MPPQDQVASESTVRAFLSLPEERKRASLGKMSEPAKQALLAGIRAVKSQPQGEAQPQSFSDRLRDVGWRKPGDIAREKKPMPDSGDSSFQSLGRMSPGSKMPIDEAMREAGAASSFAIGSGTRMGMPPARLGTFAPNWRYV